MTEVCLPISTKKVLHLLTKSSLEEKETKAKDSYAQSDGRAPDTTKATFTDFYPEKRVDDDFEESVSAVNDSTKKKKGCGS